MIQDGGKAKEKRKLRGRMPKEEGTLKDIARLFEGSQEKIELGLSRRRITGKTKQAITGAREIGGQRERRGLPPWNRMLWRIERGDWGSRHKKGDNKP